MDHMAYVACNIEEQIADLDADTQAALAEEEEAAGGKKRPSTVLRLGNITLRGVRPATTFQTLEEKHSLTDIAFKEFRVRLQRWVTRNVVWDRGGTQGQEFRFHPTDKVRDYTDFHLRKVLIVRRSKNMLLSLLTMSH